MKALLAIFVAAVCGAAPSAARAADGAVVFLQSCLMCHQAGGVGLAGQFPRLAGRVAIIGGKPAGRAYLADVLTFGMTGTVTVDDQSIFGLMPPFTQLSDDDIAAVLSYVQTLGDAQPKAPAPFTAAEIRVARAKPPKTATDVRAERQGLENEKLIP
jgi:mono/diheme cytochrome c family protein